MEGGVFYRGELELEGRLFESELLELRGDVFGQFWCGLLACGGESFCYGFEFFARFCEGGSEGLDFLGAVLNVVEAFGYGLLAGKDVFQGGAVFPFQ